jgi:hypothetical protein
MPARHQKLNESDLHAIRQRLDAGENPKILATEYGVSRPMISMIKNGRKRANLHRIQLRSGGEMTITSQVDIFALSETDQQFLNQFLQQIRDYESVHQAEPSEEGKSSP